MRVLELGNYVSVAYAGMILAEQGCEVTKWHTGKDPILGLRQGDELWEWINAGKQMEEKNILSLLDLHPLDYPDIVLDNFRPQTLEKWDVDPAQLADEMQCVWVSLRSEVGEVSFDMLAQCRSWLEYGPYLPFYIGDTAAGLWLAFKSLAVYGKRRIGHFCVGQSSCMQKLVEGELLLAPEREGRTPWDSEDYYFDEQAREGVVSFKGRMYREPVRNHAWKRQHLWHDHGRIRI